MRKSISILVLALVITLGLTPTPAEAYTLKLKRVHFSSYSVSGDTEGRPPAAGHYELRIAGDWPRGLKGTLVRGREVVAADFPLVAKNCREERVRTRGRFERGQRPKDAFRLVVTAKIDVPDERGDRTCDLTADVPFTSNNQPQQGRPDPFGPGQGGVPAQQGPTLATPPVPPQHGGPDTGGPGQGGLAAPSLPNLRIRSAKPVGGRGANELAVVVWNTGTGAAGKTALKMIYILDGVATTASAKVPALAANQKVVVQVGTSKPLAAADKITLRVDDPNKVSETDELDNGFIYSN